jgi:hypothetical protein
MSIRFRSRRSSGRCVKLTTHLCVMPKLRMSGALLAQLPMWRGKGKLYRTAMNNNQWKLLCLWCDTAEYCRKFPSKKKLRPSYSSSTLKMKPAVLSETFVLSPYCMASYTWSCLSSLPNSFYNSGNGVSTHALPQIISHVFLSNIM